MMKHIALAPAYTERFSCIGGSCEDLCCTTWNIDVDKQTYNKYKKVRDEELKPLIESSVKRNRRAIKDNQYARIVLSEEQKCSFLDENNLCLIHTKLGESYLCNTCTVYPREYRDVGGVTEKSLSLSCPEAARLLLLNPNGIDFTEQDLTNERVLFTNSLNKNKVNLLWPMRIFTIQLLQNRQYSIELRLILIGLFLQKIDAISHPLTESLIMEEIQQFQERLQIPEYIEALKNLPSNIALQIQLGKELLYENLTRGAYNQRSIDVLNDFIAGLGIYDLLEIGVEKPVEYYHSAIQAYYNPFIKDHDYILENYLVNYVFTKLFPYSETNFQDSFMMLAISFSLIKLQLIGMSNTYKGLSEDLVIKCIQSFSKAMDHNKLSTAHIKKKMNEAGLNTMAHLFILVKSE